MVDEFSVAAIVPEGTNDGSSPSCRGDGQVEKKIQR
jgi:hypothetical protein